MNKFIFSTIALCFIFPIFGKRIAPSFQIQVINDDSSLVENAIIVYQTDTVGISNSEGFCMLPWRVVDSFKYSLQSIEKYINECNIQVNNVPRYFSVTIEKVNTWQTIFIVKLLPISMENILVKAIRNNSTDFSTTVISKNALNKLNTGKDIPILLQNIPNAVSTSDAGAGIGYTGIRIRGSDASRTNITVNGVPINDAESQSTFWVNIPDIAANAASIQINRGVSSSTNGSGAFGASIHIETENNYKAFAQVQQSVGSYGTYKSSIQTSSGLINNFWLAEMRLSQIKSNGFIDRAHSNLQSYYLSNLFLFKKLQIKFIHFNGFENTYQAWNGVPIERFKNEKLIDHYNRNLGFLYKNESDSMNLFNSTKTYNYYTYKNETDNYQQGHYHANFLYNFNPQSKLNITFFKVIGKGFFEQFRYQDLLKNYAINELYKSDTIKQSDLIRQRWLQNVLNGINGTYIFKSNNWELISGFSISKYNGNHFGKIIWAQQIPQIEKDYEYYRAKGIKTDANIFTKWNYTASEKLLIQAEIQLRSISHTGSGFDNDLRKINFNKKFVFFNPQMKFIYTINNENTAFFSTAVANKEPSRTDFTDNTNINIPKAENLLDVEMGWKLNKKNWGVLIQTYLMKYKNQLVLTGKVNDVGTPLRTNVDNSYRTGIETEWKFIVSKNFNFQSNISISKNTIQQFNWEIPNYSTGVSRIMPIKNAQLAYSPNINAAIQIQYHSKLLNCAMIQKIVGKQYLDNTNSTDRSLPAFTVLDINADKNIKLGKLNVQLLFQINNVLNKVYLNNGYAYFYELLNAGNTIGISESFVFPQAPRNFMVSAIIKI